MLHSVLRATNKEIRRDIKDFVNNYHSYIKFADRPSRKLYWALFENNNMVGVFGLGSAFARPKPVMNFMEKHALKFNEVANNIVYCLANHKHKNAGTIFLSLSRKDAIKWWYERYGDTLKAFQSFILPPRTGAVYKADNWELLGETTGGVTQTCKTLYGKDREKHPEAEIRTFKSGEVKYLLREFKETKPKLIFMKLNSKREIKKELRGIR